MPYPKKTFIVYCLYDARRVPLLLEISSHYVRTYVRKAPNLISAPYRTMFVRFSRLIRTMVDTVPCKWLILRWIILAHPTEPLVGFLLNWMCQSTFMYQGRHRYGTMRPTHVHTYSSHIANKRFKKMVFLFYRHRNLFPCQSYKLFELVQNTLCLYSCTYYMCAIVIKWICFCKTIFNSP